MKWASARHGVRRTVNGFEYRVDSSCRRQFAPHYEAGAAEFLRTHIAPGAVIFNVGANVGVLTLQLAQWAGPTGRVLAFEPNPHAVKILKRNLRLNRFDRQVELVPFAIGDVTRDITFHVHGADGMARAETPNPLLPITEAIHAHVTTLDSFSEIRQLIPDWVVMDIEGWEVAALRGARRLLKGKSKRIEVVVEFHPSAWSWSGESKARMEGLLSELGRTAVPLRNQSDPLAEHGQVYLQPYV